MIKRIFFLILIISVKATFSQDKLFTLLSPDQTGVDFINIINDTKELNVLSYEYYYNGGGVAIGDVNNDGLADIYFTSNAYDCKLYINQGNLKFKDVTKEAGVYGQGGYKTGVVMVDINNDGWMDIYVCRSVLAEPKFRRNILYVNNKDGTFTDKALVYGIADEGFSTQSAFNDMDGDGDLDLMVLNHPFNLAFAKTIHLSYNKDRVLEAVKDKPQKYQSNTYYENINGKFVDKTSSAGLGTHSFGLSLILQDFNNDGLTDIFQANDYLEPDYLFINKGNKKFVNEFEKYFAHGSYSSMGSDYADINNDGNSDLIVVDMLPEGNERQKQLRRGNNYDEFEKMVKYGFGHQYVKNVLQLNNGNGSYSDISYYTGMAFSDWSWAVLINDFDNDGLKDVFISNGYLRDLTDMDYAKFNLDSVQKELIKTKNNDDVMKLLSVIPSVKIRNSYFKNAGNLSFDKENKESGLEQFAWSFGAAYADLDNDGDLDLVLNNTNENAFVYRNNTVERNNGNAISIKLLGPEKNINGIGTKIRSTTLDGIITTTVYNPMKGYLSSNDSKMVIGIGKNQQTDLLITWPDGKQESISNVTSGSFKKIKYIDSKKAVTQINEGTRIFKDVTVLTKIDHTYEENEYLDFKLEPLLPHRFSQLGPCLAVGDLNGDQLDDVFIGGAKGYGSKIYLQTNAGVFLENKQTVFDSDKLFEDGAVAFIDLDNDGDNDLIVTSGGNDYPNMEDKYPVRFYANDGKGTFSKWNYNGNIFTSSNTLAVSDLNKDGSRFIFIGGRVAPGHYGLMPKSFLLQLKDQLISDITNTTTLGKVGMVTTSAWKDMNNDGWMDLIIAGEWMPVSIYYNVNGKLNTTPVNLQNSNGWWNDLAFADIDNDGDLDIIAGNLGMNTRYRGTVEEPVTMVVNDFDRNGSTDCIISVFVKGKSYPIAIRDYVLDQMPYLKKKYLRYKQFSSATVENIFTTEQLAEATNFVANNMNSTVFINDGNGGFSQKVLPPEAQLFPVKSIQVEDINGDGIADLLLCGNNYATEVETGRNDAGIGLALLGNGAVDFKPLPVAESGFYIPGDSKCIKKIIIKGKSYFIVGKNKGATQVLGYIN